MDPTLPESFNHRTEVLSTGRTYHFVDQVPEGYDKESTPSLLCIHGFPDLWFGWRYQIGPWVNRGYRVIAPDMLGYGGSSKPEEAVEYTTKRLSADLAALLDLLDIKKAVVIGHDWGSFIASRFVLWHPDRSLALVLLSIPYSPPRSDFLPLKTIVQIAPHLGYQLYYVNPRSDAEIDSQLGKFLKINFASESPVDTSFQSLEDNILRQPERESPTVLNEKEFDYYRSQLGKGMHGPLNYYRTTEFRYNEELAANLGQKLPDDLPVFYIWGTLDATVTTASIDKAKNFIKLYEKVALDGRGHWLMVEAKGEVTSEIANWLDRLKAQNQASVASPNYKL